jgi:hypothetical protein
MDVLGEVIKFQHQCHREVVAHQHVAFGDRFSRAGFDEVDILYSAQCIHAGHMHLKVP